MRIRLVAGMAAMTVVLAASPAVAGIRAGEIERVSLGVDGQQHDDAITDWRISDDGSQVVFSTSATNLDGMAAPGIFVRDVKAHTTSRVSLLPDGSPAVRPNPYGPPDTPEIVGLSRDGGRIIFAVRDDTTWKLYLRDVEAATTTALTTSIPGRGLVVPLPGVGRSHHRRGPAGGHRVRGDHGRPEAERHDRGGLSPRGVFRRSHPGCLLPVGR